jgi:hypothetical protein
LAAAFGETMFVAASARSCQRLSASEPSTAPAPEASPRSGLLTIAAIVENSCTHHATRVRASDLRKLATTLDAQRRRFRAIRDIESRTPDDVPPARTSAEQI